MKIWDTVKNSMRWLIEKIGGRQKPKPIIELYQEAYVRDGNLMGRDENGELIAYPILADGKVSIEEKYYVDFRA